MSWWQVIALVLAAIGSAAGAVKWMMGELRKQDEVVAQLRSDHRSLKENFEAQNRLNDVTINAIQRSFEHRLEAAERIPRPNGDLRT